MKLFIALWQYVDDPMQSVVGHQSMHESCMLWQVCLNASSWQGHVRWVLTLCMISTGRFAIVVCVVVLFPLCGVGVVGGGGVSGVCGCVGVCCVVVG